MRGRRNIPSKVEQMYSINQTGELLSLSRTSIKEMVAMGRAGKPDGFAPLYVMKGRTRIPESAIFEYIDCKRVDV
jgi:hypothetical protein